MRAWWHSGAKSVNAGETAELGELRIFLGRKFSSDRAFLAPFRGAGAFLTVSGGVARGLAQPPATDL